jgi:hypothetical protein
MGTFAKLFARFLVFVYHCFDRIVIQGYLPLLNLLQESGGPRATPQKKLAGFPAGSRH